MDIPPGFIFLTQIAPRVLLLPGVAFWASHLVLRNINAIPQWLQISACLLAPHAVVYFNGVVVRYHHQQQAKSRGSVLPPRARNRWPAGIDRLVELLDNFRHGYMGLLLFLPASRWMLIHMLSIGEAHEKMCLEYGYTLRFRILFEDRVRVSAAETHIQY